MYCEFCYKFCTLLMIGIDPLWWTYQHPHRRTRSGDSSSLIVCPAESIKARVILVITNRTCTCAPSVFVHVFKSSTTTVSSTSTARGHCLRLHIQLNEPSSMLFVHNVRFWMNWSLRYIWVGNTACVTVITTRILANTWAWLVQTTR